jgi:hypothetical protein
MTAMSTSPFMPAMRNGQREYVRVAGRGITADRTREDEERRCRCIARNRGYYEGTQFDLRNEKHLNELKGQDPTVEVLPEHERLHAYSTQIAECVDFIANQLTDGFSFVADDEGVQKVIDAMVDATDVLKNGSDEDIAFDDLMIEGAQAGDTPYETLWDPIDGTAYWNFWDAEAVEFDVPRGSYVQKVTARQVRVIEETRPDGTVVEKIVQERIEYDLEYTATDLEPLPRLAASEGPAKADVVEAPHRECRRRVFWDDQEQTDQLQWLGLPFIPWGVLRVDKRGLKGFRGDPLITRKAIDNADRYNANEQQAYLIARYNAHGNLAVVGDQAMLKLELDSRVNKDVADVIRFPGGTSLQVLALPTDPSMIEHTRKVTADAMYASFGLVRVEPDTLGGLGGVSGYALEILNRKSEGTFRRIRRVFKMDCLAMINQGLDVTAYRQGSVIEDDQLVQLFEENPEMDVPAGLLVEQPFWQIDPAQVFPKRDVEIRMGSGYIVDDVQIRDDYTAGLISQEEALRLRGYADDKIEEMLQESFAGGAQIKQTEAAQFQETLDFQQSQAGVEQAAKAAAQAEQEKRRAPASKTGAGSTTGSTDRA